MQWRAVACVWALVLGLGGAGCQEDRREGRLLSGDRIELAIKEKKVSVEVASDGLSRKAGLMHRKSLPEDSGMLFIFPDRKEQGFWMSNTTIPLSVAFLDEKGTILQIEDMKPLDESTTVADHKVRHAVEMNQGWFARHGIKVGDAFADFEEKTRGIHVVP